MVNRIKNFVCAALAAVWVCGCAAVPCDFESKQCADKDGIKIGWGKRSIAMDGPVPITGQMFLRVSRGVYTPVLASALTLEKNGDAVIFVSADMVSVHPEVLKKVRKILAAELPELPGEKIILNATHTHAGPSSNDLRGPYPNKVKFSETEDVRNFLARQIADAVKDSWVKRAPGAVAYGYGFATTGHSRRTLYLVDIGALQGGEAGIAMDGKAQMYGETNDKFFDGYEAGTDSFINLFYTFDAQGKLTGTVVNVPCPSQTNEGAWVLHASFWHNVREKLSERYGDIGVICQAAAAGDLSPRQPHYKDAEMRRFRLKYADKIAAYLENPMPYPETQFADEAAARRQYEHDVVDYIRAEDIASRIVTAFDEVLQWAAKEKYTNPEFKHDVRQVKLSRRMFPKELVDQEKANHEKFMQEKYMQDGEAYKMLRFNSILASKLGRVGGVLDRFAVQDKEPFITTDVHTVKIGNMAFASNRFELYIDYMHRIQARSPFEQTFIVQLVTDDNGVGSYLATERGLANKGYSATPYCNQVSPQGGQ